ncbi:MAG: tyrosine--tRNA ligase [Gemmatimonadaceae bacterium]
MRATTTSLLDELAWRGLLHQSTEGAAAALGASTVTGYCGFDPTAPSLHVGNLVPIMGLMHLQRAGHRPVALVGGGTGMIGDPSGKSTERQLQTPEMVEENVRGIRAQLERFLEFSGPTAARMADNAEWLLPLGAVAFMRDVGKHFSVNVMLAKESVKARMETGISYTEFSYMLLQAYDFLELFRRHGVTLQIGGSDQWGNMTAGTDLIRRVEGKEAHAVTLPLVTTAAGTKFGKSEAGAVWLDASRTSPYRFYQFWVNADDRDVGRWLRFFTLKSREEVEALEAQVAADPAARAAQRELAREVTARVHGDEAARTAEEVSSILFGRGADAAGLSGAALEALRAEVPFADVAAGEAGIDVAEALVALALVKSKSEARRALDQGGVYVNGRQLASDERTLAPGDALRGRYFLLRKGRRDYGLIAVKR